MPRPTKLPQATIDKIKELYLSGKTPQQIALELGTYRQKVRYYVQKCTPLEHSSHAYNRYADKNIIVPRYKYSGDDDIVSFSEEQLDIRIGGTTNFF